MIRLALAFAAVLYSTTLEAAGPEPADPSHVVVTGETLPICPIDDCYLTYTDQILCLHLRSLFDDHRSDFSEMFNCYGDAPGAVSCLNVLAEMKTDPALGVPYQNPYLLELEAAFEIQMDLCLPEWTKSSSLGDGEQSVLYKYGPRSTDLHIGERAIDGKRFNILQMIVHD